MSFVLRIVHMQQMESASVVKRRRYLIYLGGSAPNAKKLKNMIMKLINVLIGVPVSILYGMGLGV